MAMDPLLQDKVPQACLSVQLTGFRTGRHIISISSIISPFHIECQDGPDIGVFMFNQPSTPAENSHHIDSFRKIWRDEDMWIVHTV